MNQLFLVIVADQDGDPDWSVEPGIGDAECAARIKSETSFDRPKIFEVDLTEYPFKTKERDWRK